MAYQKINFDAGEVLLRKLWKETYCDSSNKIVTHDGIEVIFYEDMFDHAFYESLNNRKADKSILSQNRCEKMLWIKEALCDKTSMLKKGWNKSSKTYEDNSRVVLVQGNYLVIIRKIKPGKAKFVTAYEMTNSDNLRLILASPNWDREGWI